MDTQYLVRGQGCPTRALIRSWLAVVLPERTAGYSVLVRITDAAESAALNAQYRGKAYATNVLSFPAEPLPSASQATPSLGDLVLCAELVRREAGAQGKALEAHWAHLLLHGLLHLLGYDHINATEARVMEALEQTLLARLGYPDPYGDETHA